MTQKQEDGLDAVRAWVLPLLLTIVGFLLVFTMNMGVNTLRDISAHQKEFTKAIDEIHTNQQILQYKMSEMQNSQQEATMQRTEITQEINDLKKKLAIR